MNHQSWRTILSVAALLVAAALSAHADTIQIATLTITTTPQQGGGVIEHVSFANQTSGDLVLNDWEQSFSGTWYGPYSLGPTTVAAGQAYNNFGCQGGCAGWSYVFDGQLSALQFVVGGESYQAASLYFTTPQWSGDYNGQIAVDIQGTDLGPAQAPEPSTLALLGSGLLGIAGMVRRKINV